MRREAFLLVPVSSMRMEPFWDGAIICGSRRARQLFTERSLVLKTVEGSKPRCMPSARGSALLFKIPRLVMGENVNFQGAEDWLQKNGVEVINLKNEKCEKLMAKFIEERPGDWYEDIGESEK
ncbi:hypothetical protein KL935_005358 [Ogataea polymorpha]|nr:hypothetical protein KL935_005358 [Ogataea polymorpha]KAG7905147.1 hypothetical protein KL906_005330 [Ogataea polymorpha]KAG7912955.1 hypothetical protein KL927_005376 [Ogataea polymorpha]